MFVRVEYMRDVSALRQAGASTVVSAEGEVALAMASALLDALGASPERIAKERDRVHDVLRQRAEAGHGASPGPSTPHRS